MAATEATELRLDPPTFTVDEENSDLQLWSFRLPVSLPVTALQDVTLALDGTATTFTANGKEYRIQMGDVQEMESFRVLIPQTDKEKDESSSSSEDDDDDDDDDDDEKEQEEKGTLRPCRLSFSKHFQVLANVQTLTESQLAPREGPTPEDKMRHAYAPIAQRSGLKRRWMPVGANPLQQDNHTSTKKQRTKHVKMEKESSHPRKRIKLDEGASDQSDSSSEEDKNLSKTERKAKKAEKKAAKKAKKEAKKAKKAAKKAKKEKH